MREVTPNTVEGKMQEYFGQYPMVGKKKEVYAVWLGVREMVLRGDHLTDKLPQVLAEVGKVQELNGWKGGQ